MNMEVCVPVACICLLMLSASAIAQTTTNFSQPAPIARPGCQSRCGHLTVPYPFGIGIGSQCAFDDIFEMTCDTSSNPPRGILNGMRADLVDLSEKHLWVTPGIALLANCYDSKGALVNQPPYARPPSVPLLVGKVSNHYSFSPDGNKIAIVGCDDTLLLHDGTNNHNNTSTCTSRCSNASQLLPHIGACSGIGCCQLPIPRGSNNTASMVSTLNHTKVWSFNPCAYMFYGDTSRFTLLGASDFSNPNNFQQTVLNTVPVVLDWAIGNLNCKQAQNTAEYACQANSHCVDSDTGYGGYRCTCDYGYQGNPYLGCIADSIGKLSCKEAQNSSGYGCHANSHCVDSDTGGYLCHCNQGYEGYPYLSPGCTDVDECKNSNNTCELGCINVPGGYKCTCFEGYYGDGRKDGEGCHLINKKSDFPWFKFFLGIGLGIFALVAMATSLCYVIKKTNRAKMRFKLFEQNGGFLLKEKMTPSDGGSNGSDVPKIFSAKELKEATNNYAQDMILGRGGNGIVFKGILPNLLQVAIKRSRTVDDTQIEQFINEVVILSRINHRQVVKFLGCCLEAEVPLLVYEYICNGTLHQHIHREAGASDWLSWENRLRIAIEAAGALAYLHSAASMPIIHRDVKSTNILIDENYTAKISDFGASRLVPLDRTHVATLVQGTLGYLDPEYFQTSRLTEKSDVYSFGVVLAELLTERKPVFPNMSEEEDRNLSAFFVRSMNANRLFQIIVPRLVREGTIDQLQRIAELVKRCLELKGEDRPQMKEVVTELERIRNSAKGSWAEPSCYVLEEDEALDLYAVPISP